jgi:biotin operon repressor
MKNQNGWIKLHRQILEWEWYEDINCFRLFTHLLLKANHKEKRYKGIVIKAGQIVTSRDLLAQETGLSSQQVRTAITKLKSTNEITSVTSSQGTIIEVVNYEKYQLSTNEITEEQPTSNQRVTTNKNDKNNKENIYRHFKHLSLSKDEFNKLCIDYTKQQIDDILDQIENNANNKKYSSLYLTAKNWLGRNKVETESISPEEEKAIRLGFLKPNK